MGRRQNVLPRPVSLRRGWPFRAGAGYAGT